MAFLSAEVPRWTPKSEADIERAIADNLLEETHWWDAKQQLNTGKPANRAIAADLAAFSVDGGSILVGLHEDKPTNTFSLAPQPSPRAACAVGPWRATSPPSAST